MVMRVLRYQVPVDDAWHTLPVLGAIVHVATRSPEIVEFWAYGCGPERQRTFRVFGTGHPIPEADAYTTPVYTNTAIVPGGALVWHLFELVALSGGAHPGSPLDGGVPGA